MADYTVSEVAAMARVSVRTLHHYHEIGLLRPAHVGDNGYRYYGRAELLRLQQILIHRELGIPLAEIGALLDAPGFDRLATLRQQRGRLAEEAARFAEMLRTIDRTIADLEGDRAMKDADLYSGVVDPKKQAEYEAWLDKRMGAGTVAKSGKPDMAAMPAMMAELRDIEQPLAQALRDGIAADSTDLDPLLERHFAWVKKSWRREASPAAYAGLADIYDAHPDFTARFEAIEPGFAAYLTSAMRDWAARQLRGG